MELRGKLERREAFSRTWRRARSACRCGHSGDGQASAHGPGAVAVPGHGPCLLAGCNCSKFVWATFTETFQKALDAID